MLDHGPLDARMRSASVVGLMAGEHATMAVVRD